MAATREDTTELPWGRCEKTASHSQRETQTPRARPHTHAEGERWKAVQHILRAGLRTVDKQLLSRQVEVFEQAGPRLARVVLGRTRADRGVLLVLRKEGWPPQRHLRAGIPLEQLLLRLRASECPGVGKPAAQQIVLVRGKELVCRSDCNTHAEHPRK